MSALKQTIDRVLDEPACATNRAKGARVRKAGCGNALKPGAAAGGCAFDGAKIALQPIADVAHLVHGPIGCEGNSWDSRHSLSSGPDLYRTGFTTDLGEFDVINGGERRLYRAILQVAESHRPAAIFVYATCVTAMIGDDIGAVCRAAQQRCGRPVIPVDVPGFAGSKNLGAKLAGQVLLDHVIGTEEPADAGPCDLDIVAEFNVAGDLWNVTPLFDRLGIRLRACITGDSRYRDIATAHRANATMMVCSTAMLNVARGLEERWGIPWFEGSFFGMRDTSDALRGIARLLASRGAPADLPARAEALIGEREAAIRERLDHYRRRLAGKRALVFTGGVKSWSVVSALDELGMTVVGTSTRKSTAEDKRRIAEIMGTEAHMYDELPPREMDRILRSGEADIMLSGGRSQFVALKARMPWVEVNQERHVSYAGYEGLLTLAETIDRTLSNPVWDCVRRPPPWDAEH